MFLQLSLGRLDDRLTNKTQQKGSCAHFQTKTLRDVKLHILSFGTLALSPQLPCYEEAQATLWNVPCSGNGGHWSRAPGEPLDIS